MYICLWYILIGSSTAFLILHLSNLLQNSFFSNFINYLIYFSITSSETTIPFLHKAMIRSLVSVLFRWSNFILSSDSKLDQWLPIYFLPQYCSATILSASFIEVNWWNIWTATKILTSYFELISSTAGSFRGLKRVFLIDSSLKISIILAASFTILKSNPIESKKSVSLYTIKLSKK